MGKRRAINTVLIFPPSSSCTSMHMAIPALAAYMQSCGKRVACVDLNLALFQYVNSSSTLEQHMVSLLNAIRRYQDMPVVCGGDAIRLADMSLAYLRHNYVHKHSDDAVKCQRDAGRLSNNAEKLWSRYVLNAAYWGYGALDGSELSMEGWLGEYSPYSSNDMMAFLENPSRAYDGFIDYAMNRIPTLRAGMDVVGISVSFRSQILPSLLICKRLRNAKSQARIVLGGTSVDLIARAIRRQPELCRYIDDIVIGPGEFALKSIIESEEAGECANRNRSSVHTRHARLTAQMMLSLPIPAYECLPMEEYPVAFSSLPLRSRINCLWNQCAFCLHHYEGMPSPAKPAQRIADEMNVLRARYGTTRFSFLDECISPEFAHDLATRVRGTSFRWYSHMRFGNGELADVAEDLSHGGCIALKTGLESIVDADLVRMGKGTTRSVIERTIRRLHNARIRLQASFFCGFPGQEWRSAMSTADFLWNNGRSLHRVAFFGPFELASQSIVFNMPQRYGVFNIRKYNASEDLLDFYRYETRSGMSQEEAIDCASVINRRLAAMEGRAPKYADGHTCYWLPAAEPCDESQADCGVAQVPLQSGETEVAGVLGNDELVVESRQGASGSTVTMETWFPLIDILRDIQRECSPFPVAKGRLSARHCSRGRAFARQDKPVRLALLCRQEAKA